MNYAMYGMVWCGVFGIYATLTCTVLPYSMLLSDFKIGRIRTTATVGRESAHGSSQTAHDH